MTNGQKAELIGRYVDEAVQPFLTAHRDIEKVEYKSDSKNGYIKLTTAFGRSNYYDVTNLDCGQICIMLCVVITGTSVKTQIKDIEAIREVERLFK